jgi:hypothetical protein
MIFEESLNAFSVDQLFRKGVWKKTEINYNIQIGRTQYDFKRLHK